MRGSAGLGAQQRNGLLGGVVPVAILAKPAASWSDLLTVCTVILVKGVLCSVRRRFSKCQASYP